MTVDIAAGAITAAPTEGRLPPSSRAAIDAALETLKKRRSDWAALPILDRIDLLRQLRVSFAEVAEEWVEACMAAEKLTGRTPRIGEEWVVGPYFVLRNLRLLQVALRNISVVGRPRIPGPLRLLPNGQTAAEVFPFDRWDRVFYPRVRGEVWMEPGVTPESLGEHQARAYRTDPPGRVALVLSAGNVSSIGPMDALYKLFVDKEVVVYKTHHVNDHLGPLLERGFRPLVEAGFLRVVYGGVEEGAYLTDHPTVGSIHVTGSDKTYEAIVFGPGPEGERRKAERQPRLTKAITAELGNVSPVIVVPGRWSAAEMAYQAENVATMLTNNAGFNCNAIRLLVTWREWGQRQELLDAVRQMLRQVAPRHAWYPGAHERFRTFLAAHPEAERYGGAAPDELPWMLVPDLDPASEDLCFTTESFCSVFGEVALSSSDPAGYLRRAVDFCNERVWGSLNATVLLDPRSGDDPAVRAAVEDALAHLRYGTVSINHWAAIGYGVTVTPWGAHPGHPPWDIQSGTGWVHNSLMFDRPQKSVFRAPFTTWPKPPWFATHRTSWALGKKLTAFEASPSLWRLPAILGDALRG